jgi:penicillin-binding protein 1C
VTSEPAPPFPTILRRRRRLAVAAALALVAAGPFCWFLLLDLLFPFPEAALHRPAAAVVTDRHGAPLRFFLPADERWRFPVTLAELPPELPRALIASEDRRFYSHPGIDPLAVLRAARSNLAGRRVVSGASTLPMQIARMAEPGPRTLASKARESFRALQLTAHHGKRELLEIYLNLLPYGGNVEGVGAAAYFYFGKAPERLSLGEIALLTALPRSPVRYDPTRFPQAARAARDRVLAQLGERGVFPPREVAAARLQGLPGRRRRPPFTAAHWSEWIARKLPGAARIATTLDLGVQQIAEEQVRGRIADLRAQGIGNAAVVVIENRSRAVRALVGSAGFAETLFEGQVNGALARRSPGSTLKPFLYAQAIDAGKVVPETYLLDVPTDYAGYVPENYDERYRGRVTVREALILSLNASAVRLLADVGLADFHRLLLRGGLSTLEPTPRRYGLPLILGAAEVTLLDLTDLYASLAEGGTYRPVRVLENDLRPAPPERLVSPEAAALVTEILTDVRRPDLPESWDLSLGAPAVAWKTGTSYGHRDAWAVGFSSSYTIGVWVGNFDGTPRLGISGSQHAGPLLFDLFRAVDREGRRPVRSPALRLGRIEVCALSHELPGPFCPERIEIDVLPGKSRIPACTLHRRVLVDARSGELLSGDCLGEHRSDFRLLTLYPPELVAWWRAQGQAPTALPGPAPGCRGVLAGDPPRIVSPSAATPYRIRREAPLEDQRIPLVAHASPEAARLFWYQDGTLAATAAPGAPVFVTPVAGEHRVAVTDDLGRTDSLTYRVEGID